MNIHLRMRIGAFQPRPLNSSELPLGCYVANLVRLKLDLCPVPQMRALVTIHLITAPILLHVMVATLPWAFLRHALHPLL